MTSPCGFLKPTKCLPFSKICIISMKTGIEGKKRKRCSLKFLKTSTSSRNESCLSH
uniref:Uncharacterized protein n=1 Tax=Rhizophora mucronata TaxID=61149 RepID=A0A2P2NB53_RHIMU